MSMKFTDLVALCEGLLNIPIVKNGLIHLAETWDTPEVLGTQLDEWFIYIIYRGQKVTKKERKIEMVSAFKEVQKVYDTAKLEYVATGDSHSYDELKTWKKIDAAKIEKMVAPGPWVPPWINSEVGTG